MKFYHATPNSNLASIQSRGLDPTFSKHTAKFTWMCTEGNVEWAILHIMDKHKIDLSEVVVIELNVPRSWVKNHRLTIRGKGRRGFWKTDRVINTDRFQSITSGETFGHRD
jgi:hypothetical protein